MKVTVKYFASIREVIGVGSEPVETVASTLGDLRDALIARGGTHAVALARGRALRVAQNQVMAREDMVLHEGAEVAFFPPVTGG
jgi:sulfur-carrier protein